MAVVPIAVFQATFGWLVHNGRDKAVEKLSDVTHKQFRNIIMGEIDDTSSKLDGLSKKDLRASISFFREGIELLYEGFDEIRSRSEFGADTAQATCAEVVSLTERMRNLELTESATRKLSRAKKRFEQAREWATIAFSNEALSTTDRILAMQYRVMATVLEAIENPSDAIAPCKVCIKELNGLPTVQQSFKVQLKTGISAVMGLFYQEERVKIISGVCRVNRVAFDVTQAICSRGLLLLEWPNVDTGEEKVDLLHDRRLALLLREQGMEQCDLSWTIGQDGEKEHRIKNPLDIATNSSGQYIVADYDLTIKVFDNSGKFVKCFRLPPLIDDNGKELSTENWKVKLATDINDNIYVLVEENIHQRWIFKFDKSADQYHKFRERTMDLECNLCKLSVSDSGKVMVLKGNYTKDYHFVDLYETDGQFVCSFGEQNLKSPRDISTVSDGRVMVVDQTPSHCVHIFSELGDHLSKFDLKGFVHFPNIAFHRESQQVVLASTDDEKELLCIGIYTKDGEFVRSVFIYKSGYFLYKIAVSTEGRIAALGPTYVKLESGVMDYKIGYRLIVL